MSHEKPQSGVGSRAPLAMWGALFLLVALAAGCRRPPPGEIPPPFYAPPESAVSWPGSTSPGPAEASVEGDLITVGNRVLTGVWSVEGGRLRPQALIDRQAGVQFHVSEGEAFRLDFANGETWGAGDCAILSGPRVSEVEANPESSRLAERYGGRRVEIELESPSGRARFVWTVELRNEANALRTSLTVLPRTTAVAPLEFTLLHLPAAEAEVAGSARGCPATMRNFFASVEHPRSQSTVEYRAPEDNLALGKPVSASDHFAVFGPSKAVDGDYSYDEPWISWSLPATLMVDLGEIRQIGATRAITDGNTPSPPFRIEVSEGGERWQAAANLANTAADSPNHSQIRRFSPINGRYVRILFPRGENSQRSDVRLVEFEVYPATINESAFPVIPANQRVSCAIECNGEINPEQALTRTAAIGVAPAGQMRRAYLYYIERYRARPYRPFLHYNAWGDLSWVDARPNESECLGALQAFASELARKRNVRFDGFILARGWDDPESFWQPSPDAFPNGLEPLTQLARRSDIALGLWISPWGGYGERGERRISALSASRGIEPARFGLDPAGKPYRSIFSEGCRELVRDAGVRAFLYDAIDIGTAAQTDALTSLTTQLRQTDPRALIASDRAAWPSPYWLGTVDALKRGGADIAWSGEGPQRERWITFRDMDAYRSVVKRSPLFPLNALDLGGVQRARHGYASELGDDPKAFRHEVRSFFASGAGWQTLHITPGMMTARAWDDLAEAARWARARRRVLVDAHWVGGDPGANEVYGWAAWSEERAALALRNPTAEIRSIALRLRETLDLPANAPRRYALEAAFSDRHRDRRVVDALEPVAFRLEPFEILVLEALPGPEAVGNKKEEKVNGGETEAAPL